MLITIRICCWSMIPAARATSAPTMNPMHTGHLPSASTVFSGRL
jgi:hypothetical protein